VLSARYNDFFLNKFLPTRIFTEKPLSFFGSIKMLPANLFSFFQKKRKALPEYDLFLDLNGIRELDIFLKVKEQNLCRYYASFNMGIWNGLLDYADKKYPVIFTKDHIIDSCKRLVKDALGLRIDIADDNVELSDKMVKPEGFDIEKFILLNISGQEQHRGPAARFYAVMINILGFKGKVVVMDELGRPHLKEFENQLTADNVIYLDKDYSLWELAFIASKSLLYIGADSGVSHLLQRPTNALLFFANSPSEVWRPYSKNPYTRRKLEGIIIDETKTSQGLHKKIIHCYTWCQPCFDIGCHHKKCIRRLEKEKEIIASEIEEMVA
jgi:ADP-heptose:LPS heptosyltransferase